MEDVKGSTETLEPGIGTETAFVTPVSNIEMSKEIKDICGALAKAQKKIQNAERDSANPFFNSSYASLASDWDACREHITAEGLSIIQAPASKITGPDGTTTVNLTTMLLHETGQWFRSTITLPVVPVGRRKRGDATDTDNDADRAPGKVTAQAIGSAITYARRYALECMVGIAPEADEDDGQAASGGKGEHHTPIPADGKFEDVVKSVTFREQARKAPAAGTFKIYKVATGEHGLLECFEEVGIKAEELAGKGEKCHFIAVNKGRFGWSLQSVVVVPKIEGVEELAWVSEMAAAVRDTGELTALKKECEKKGGLYWTGHVTNLLKKRHEELKAAGKPKTEAEAKAGIPASQTPVFVEVWIKRIKEVKTVPDFQKLENDFIAAPEIKEHPGNADLLNAAGSRLSVEGYV